MLPTLQNQPAPEVIDLGLGDPPLALLPLELLRNAARQKLAQDDRSLLQYGAEQGDGRFLQALASFLTQGYGFEIHTENLFITNGISNALDLICTFYTQPGDTIFVEEPTYFLALRIFADHRLNVVPIEMDPDGINLDELEAKLAEQRPRFLYVIPTFHNPSGATLTAERRDRLVALAHEHDFLIVADEVYHLLSYAGQPPKSFAAYAEVEGVLALGSFSKILAPGLRLGWLHAHPKTIRRFTSSGLLDSSGGLNPFTSALVGELLFSGGLEENIRLLIQTYQARAAVLEAALREQLPELAFQTPRGGYFLWLLLPEHIDAAELRKVAPAFKVDFRPGRLFSSCEGLAHHLRLCFVHYEEAEIREGVLRLKACLTEANRWRSSVP